MTGAGKPVIVADLLAQIGNVSIQVHRRRRIAACGSHVDARRQPVIINPKIFLEIVVLIQYKTKDQDDGETSRFEI